MKTKEQIKAEIKRLKIKQDKIRKDTQYCKNDRIAEVKIRIRALKWVLREQLTKQK